MPPRIPQSIFFVFLLFSLLSPGIAPGESFPTRPIDLYIPFAPGGISDTMGRALGPKLGEVLGQPIVPVNKPGASGALAVALLAKSKADGYTILIVSNSSLTVVPHFENMGYNPLSDFTFLCKTYDQTSMLVVPADSPFKNFQEVIDFAQKNPRKLKYGTWGQFSGVHIAMEAIGLEKKIEWGHVPFKGEGPVVPALLGKHIDLGVLAPGGVPHIKAGKLRLLLVLQGSRSKAFPEAPCFRDVGINFDGKGSSELMSGIIAPRNLSTAIRKKFEDALKEAVKSHEFLRASATLGLDPLFLPGDKFQKEIEAGNRYVGEVVKKIDLKK